MRPQALQWGHIQGKPLDMQNMTLKQFLQRPRTANNGRCVFEAAVHIDAGGNCKYVPTFLYVNNIY